MIPNTETKTRIVIVDDDIAVLNSLKRVLRREFDVYEFSNPLEVEGFIENNEVDLLLSDEMMPEMKGSELVGRIHEKHPEICKIILSGQADKDDIVKAINFGGIFAFLFKPIDKEQLIQTINNGIENRRMKVKIIEQNKKLHEANEKLHQSNLVTQEKNEELKEAYTNLEEAHEELKLTQSQLVQTEKMAALGNLVAGVAHEINNPVGAVNSAADVLSRCIAKINEVTEITRETVEFTDNTKLNKYIGLLSQNNQVIIEAGARISKIVRSLKNFARLDEADFQKTDIHEGIESTLTLVYHELKNKVTVEKDFGVIPRIHCYPNQLNQVFMNLFVNSSQAICEKGYLRIKTYSKENKVFIEVSDTGKGIPAENVNKIFDPGFTTKGVGVGTGLGLSISYNIIRKHHGEILVESEPGKGSKFTVILPVTQK